MKFLIYLFRLTFPIQPEWIYGICNDRRARKHRKKGNVQFVLFKKGDQAHVDGIGHTEDKWVNFDSSWWRGFKADEKLYTYGELNGKIARKHIYGQVEFLLWKKGEQGVRDDFWHTFEYTHWNNFRPFGN